MKEAIVSAKGESIQVQVVDSPIPKPGPDQVLIKVVVSGTNPKDWKYPSWNDLAQNSGDDIAGTIESVGDDVVGYHHGDRVAAFHVMRTPHGSFAEYAIAPADTTFHLPKNISFEEGATIPLAAGTAVVGLFIRLGLPEPWTGGREDGKILNASTAVKTGPLLIYGAATAVGAFAIQFAKRANIGPIIAVAGRGTEFVQSLLDPAAGDKIVDYRQDTPKLIKAIEDAVPAGSKLQYCFDTVTDHGSFANASQVLKKTPGSKLTLVLPKTDSPDIAPEVERSMTMVGDVHGKQKDFGAAWFALFGRAMREGWLKPHPYTVVPGGLAGVQEGLTGLKEGKNSASKYVYRIAETPGV